MAKLYLFSMITQQHDCILSSSIDSLYLLEYCTVSTVC